MEALLSAFNARFTVSGRDWVMSNVIPLRRRSRSPSLLAICIGTVGILAVGVGALSFFSLDGSDDPQKLAASTQGIVRAMPICGFGRRINCVVDGDTLWLDGEKIRLDSINAPEVEGR